MFDLNHFTMINRPVQEEPIQEHDKFMYGMLAGIGIQRGKKFDPSPEVVENIANAVSLAP